MAALLEVSRLVVRERAAEAAQDRCEVSVRTADQNLVLHVVCDDCRVGLQDVGQIDYEAENSQPRQWDFGCCVCGDPTEVRWQVMVWDEASAVHHNTQKRRF